jgi:hypothetical protein
MLTEATSLEGLVAVSKSFRQPISVESTKNVKTLGTRSFSSWKTGKGKAAGIQLSRTKGFEDLV